MNDDRRFPGDRRRGEEHGPGADPRGWERAIRRIVAAAAPELARRRAAIGPGLLLERWATPLLTAAAVLVLLSGAGLLRSAGSGEGVSAEAPGLEEALFPPVVAAWLRGEGEPTVEELVFEVPEEDG